MRIVYDAYIFLSQKTGGISRYHYELFKGMRQRGCEADIAGLFVKNQYLLSDSRLKRRFIADPTASFAFFNKLWLKQRLKRMDANTIFHPSFPLAYIREEMAEAKNRVFTIHDMIVEKEKKEAPGDKRYFAQNADRIIAVSEATKKDIVELWGIDGAKIEVIHHGSSLHSDLACRPATPLPATYLLYVGNRDGHKNFMPFVRAIAPLLMSRAELHLVCAGRRPFTAEESRALAQTGIAAKTVFVGKPTDGELAYLYGRAALFVFPSLNEGFGIPILEAWACGAPVVLSDNPCFREVAEDAGHYFRPDSEESIRDAVEHALSDASLRAALVKRGAARLRFFSWEKAVGETYQLYHSLL
jgi:glycosyltransferase involved in cell wall biosynthesis